MVFTHVETMYEPSPFFNVLFDFEYSFLKHVEKAYKNLVFSIVSCKRFFKRIKVVTKLVVPRGILTK